MPPEYDVFLSYDGADKAAVEEIAVRLRDAALRPFFDEWHLVPGDLRIPALEAAIEGSPTIVVLIGPKGMRWSTLAKVRREIIDFSTEWVRHTCFFGREDVFEEMDAWLAAGDRGWLLITDGPGLGKSATSLVPNGPTRSQPSHLHWCHSTVHPIVRPIASANPAAIMSSSLVLAEPR